MSYDTPDVYYSPEKFGLTQIAEIDVGGSYEFDKFTVWRHADGRIFWDSDSGCSCPSPFEDCTSLESLKSGTADECMSALRAWDKEQYKHAAMEEIDRFEQAVRGQR